MLKTDVLIAGSGCSGLYCALRLPAKTKIIIISKSDLECNDSYLAQGGMCVLKEEADYEDYFRDTLKAGHFENDETSVSIMIRSSQHLVKDLLDFGVDFNRETDGSFAYTREGAHSKKRILFHKDITGKEITRHLLAEAKKRPNITFMEYTSIVDIIEKDHSCIGAVIRLENGRTETVDAAFTVLATGGIGGLYRHSTNQKHLTGDGLAISLRHGIRLKDVHFIQIHPTTFYSDDRRDRSFLISESVRGEGALLYDKNMNRFVNELLPRDLLSLEIRKQMEKDGTDFVWEDLRTIPRDELISHFPNIVEHCRNHGYDVFRQCIPVVPAQHYYMGGIWVDHQSRTSLPRLYAIGETACNGVHGRNRLASNSLLESMVFAGRAADEMTLRFPLAQQSRDPDTVAHHPLEPYEDPDALEKEYALLVQNEITKRQSEDPLSAESYHAHFKFI